MDQLSSFPARYPAATQGTSAWPVLLARRLELTLRLEPAFGSAVVGKVAAGWLRRRIASRQQALAAASPAFDGRAGPLLSISTNCCHLVAELWYGSRSKPTKSQLDVKITEYREVALDQIEIGLSQARTRDVAKNLDDLARSMNTVGLLEPIVVAPVEGRYEVVTGQRRYLAAVELRWDSIRAGILESRPDDAVSKAISLTENMIREDMSTKDYIDVCTMLYHRYGSFRSVSEELGLPIHRVRQYVKYEQLIPELKEQVDSGLKMDVALRAQKAATSEEGDVEEDKALAFADEMKAMSGLQKKQLEKAAVQHPDAPTEEIIEIGRRQPKEHNLTVVLSVELRDALDRYASEEGTNRAEAAVTIIESRLVADGYANSEN